MIKLAGRIGAGAEIFAEHEQEEGEHATFLEVPLSAPPDAIAFEVVGDSMAAPLRSGEIVVAGSMVISRDRRWLGSCCRDSGWAPFLKKLRLVGDGLFDLESHNASAIRAVKLECGDESRSDA